MQPAPAAAPRRSTCGRPHRPVVRAATCTGPGTPGRPGQLPTVRGDRGRPQASLAGAGRGAARRARPRPGAPARPSPAGARGRPGTPPRRRRTTPPSPPRAARRRRRGRPARSRRVSPVAAALALAQQPGRRRRDDQPGRRAVPLVQLLPGRRREHHLELDLPGRHARSTGRWVRCATAVDDQRLLGQPHPASAGAPPTRRRPGRSSSDDRVARLGQPGEQRADLTGRRVVPAYRAVVGVADRDRAVGQRRHAQRVLQQGLGGRAVDVAEVEQPAADGGAARRRRRGGAATRSRSRPARAVSPLTASPEVWANHASAAGPSSSPSLVVPARTATDPVQRVEATRAGGCRPSRPRPGPWYQARSHGEDRSAVPAAPHPLPAAAGDRA